MEVARKNPRVNHLKSSLLDQERLQLGLKGWSPFGSNLRFVVSIVSYHPQINWTRQSFITNPLSSSHDDSTTPNITRVIVVSLQHLTSWCWKTSTKLQNKFKNGSSNLDVNHPTCLRCHIVRCSSFGWHCLRMLGATRALYLAKWHGRRICDWRISSHPVMYIFTSSIQNIFWVCLRTLFVDRCWFWNRMTGWKTCVLEIWMHVVHVVLEFKSWFPYLSLCDDAGQAKILRRPSEKHIFKLNATKAACLHCIPCATCKGDHTVSATLTGYGICMWTKIQIRLTCSTFQRPRQ